LIGVNPKPRRLTSEEIDLLRKSKQEIQRRWEYFCTEIPES